MTVRAKFFVESVQHYSNGDDAYANILMKPVFGSLGDGDDETNKSWSKWTPAGCLQITITNPAAIDKFDMGKSYFLDFTPAD